MSEEIRKLDYQETLCMHMLRYSALGDFTNNMRPSEVKEKLEPFFPKEMMEDMITLVTSGKDFETHQFL